MRNEKPVVGIMCVKKRVERKPEGISFNTFLCKMQIIDSLLT